MNDYTNSKALSYSGAKELLRSPAHYQAWLKAEETDTEALRMGRLVHLASLEPIVFDAKVRVMPECDRRTKEGKAIYEAFAATLKPDEECIKQDEMDVVLAIAESAQAGIEKVCTGSTAARLKEQPFYGRYMDTAIKGRPDLVLDGELVLDVKTTASALADDFARDVWKYRYFLQAAWYLRLTGAKRFFFVAVEKKPPYAHAIYELDEESIAIGQKLMDSACITFRECERFGQWPSLPSDPQVLSLPKWAKSASLDV